MTDNVEDFAGARGGKDRNRQGDVEGVFTIPREDGHLAEMLTQLREPDWARVLFMLSSSARDEIRAALGTLQGMASLQRPSPRRSRPGRKPIR